MAKNFLKFFIILLLYLNVKMSFYNNSYLIKTKFLMLFFFTFKQNFIEHKQD